MAVISNVVKSPIQGAIGTLNRSSGYEYRDFWYTDASGKRVHVVGYHRAVDITTLGTVVAFARGKVVAITKGVKGQTTNPSSGNSVTLLHANGCKTLYCHLDYGSNDHLNVGDIVEEGAKLGTDVVQTTGNSTGLHMHFAIFNPNETYQNSNYMNPIDYMQGKKALLGYEESKPLLSLDEIAQKVIRGDYGNYPERKDRLEAEGYNYEEVRQRVNEILASQNNNQAPNPAPTPVEIKAGDTVIVNGFGTQDSYGNGAKTKVYVNQPMKVIGVASHRKNAYALNQYNRGNAGDWSMVTAWFNRDSISK